MGKLAKTINKTKWIFPLILVETFIAVGFGMLSFLISNADKIPNNIYVNGVSIGGMKAEQAKNIINEIFESGIKNENIIVKIDRDYSINMSDIGASVDIESTIKKASGNNLPGILYRMGLDLSNSHKKEILPSVKINEGLLKMEIDRIASYLDKSPMNAQISVKNGYIEKSQDIAGSKLDTGKLFLRVSDRLREYIGKSSLIVPAADLVGVIEPEVKIADLETAADIISSQTVEIREPLPLSSVKDAAEAINRVIIHPSDKAFSFNKQLELKNLIKDKEDNGYNAVASALYAAVLKAGIDYKSIVRTHSRTSPDYAEPGLDAYVSGTKYDFGFINTLDHNITILTELVSNKLTVYIVGSKLDTPKERELNTEVIGRNKPPLIKEEDRGLLKGQIKVISPGKDGLKISVSRDGTQLYVDTYDALQAVVRIGPGTETENYQIK